MSDAVPDGDAGMTRGGSRVPLRLPDAIVRQPLIEVSADRALLRLPGAGRVLVTADHIVGASTPGCSPAHLAPLADPALALQWLLRAVPALRAASVAHHGRAVLLSGTGPVGTSTIAAALALRGWRVLGDAVAPVIVTDGTVVVVPTTDTVALWPDALAALGLDAELGAPVRPGLAKRAVPVGEMRARDHGDSGQRMPGSSPHDVSGLLADVPLPVDMVVLVRQSNHEPLGAAGYSGSRAVTAMGHSVWHHAIASAMPMALPLDASAGQLGWAMALTTGARIVRVTVPRHGDPAEAASLVAGITDGTIGVAPA